MPTRERRDENKFIASIDDQLDTKGWLSNKQEETLETIWNKVTRDG